MGESLRSKVEGRRLKVKVEGAAVQEKAPLARGFRLWSRNCDQLRPRVGVPFAASGEGEEDSVGKTVQKNGLT
jgi:hypothetical protein